MRSLLDRRLLLVTGKGGVGKTTVSTALALAAARTGRRACVIELSGQEKVPLWLGLGGRQFRPRPIAEGCDVISLTAMECLEDFGHRKLHLGPLTSVVLGGRVMTAFVDTLPGFHDLLQLGKIENMITEPKSGDTAYDLIVVDAPATGHGATLLQAAQTMTSLTRVGPFHDLAQTIARLLTDTARTGVVVVTLPEELPVSETLDLVDLVDEAAPNSLATVVVNQARPRALPSDGFDEVRAAVAAIDPTGALVSLLDGASDRDRALLQAFDTLRAGLLERLGVAPPIVSLPRLPHGDLTRDDAFALAAVLGRHLGAK